MSINLNTLENPYIAWGDVESTNLDERDDDVARLLEVAFVITDTDFKEVGKSFHKVIYNREEDIEILLPQLNPYVIDMHEKTGLWERTTNPQTASPLETVDAELSEFLGEFTVNNVTPVLAGNSITLDRNFLRKFLPNTFSQLHYRSIDMSSVDLFSRCCKLTDFVLEKSGTHNALTDIRESIMQAQVMRDYFLRTVGY